MRMKYLTLLIASLAFVAQSLYDGRVLAQDKEKEGDAPIQTDKKAYKVVITPRSVKFTINYSYVNRTGGAVFLPTCRTPYRPSIGFRPSFQTPRPTRQKDVRQKNEEDQTHSLFFCLTSFCLVAETMIKAGVFNTAGRVVTLAPPP